MSSDYRCSKKEVQLSINDIPQVIIIKLYPIGVSPYQTVANNLAVLLFLRFYNDRHLIIGLFYGSLYFQMDTGTDPSVYFNRLALIYFSLTFAIVGQQASIPVLIGNRLVFYRERGSNAYGVTAYWFSLWFLELPIIAINMFIYAVIVYYMSGMRSSFNSFLIFYVGLLLVAWTGLFSSLIVACLASSVQIAMGLFPVSLFFATAFAGYMVFIPQFPIWLRCWAPYSSFMRFGFQALTLNEFDSNDSLPDYQEYLNQLGFNGVTVTGCILALAVYVGVYCLGLLVTLKYVDFEER